ncbi:MAG: hypothetical protein ACRD0K_13600 [Egibacteraceae bacterium]
MTAAASGSRVATKRSRYRIDDAEIAESSGDPMDAPGDGEASASGDAQP